MSNPYKPPTAELSAPTSSLSATGRYVILVTAFLGWFFAGVQMSITPLMSRSATISLRWPEAATGPLSGEEKRERESQVGKWFSWFNATFLMGAAVGGLLFGWLGDKAGRARAMGLSILCFTVMSGMGYFARSTEELLAYRFIACLGVGGMWPNGIALASEAWSDVSRPMLAGLIGTAANVGQVGMAMIAIRVPITTESWRWVLLLASTPAVLGLFVLLAVPESPSWLAGRASAKSGKSWGPVAEVFRPPLLWLTLVGICLGTIPLLGGWGSGNWLVPWADQVGATSDLKAWIQLNRSFGGTISSLLGGWVAGLVGRRKSYFLISLGALVVSEFVYFRLTPADGWLFAAGAFMVGLIAGTFFGWLPLCLPELFPTRVRSTGAGVTFNFGRIASALGVFGAGVLIQAFDGNYARVGQITSLIYVLGMVVILFAPDTSQRKMSE